MKPTDFNIPKEKLQFKKSTGEIHDQKLETKPIGYFKDAWNRFKKNKASIVATVIIGILVLFAIIVPIFSKYKVSYSDDPKYPSFNFALPRSDLFSALGVDFWDGCKNNSLDENSYLRLKAIEQETGTKIVKRVRDVKTEKYFTDTKVTYYFRENSYYLKGVEYRTVTLDEYKLIQDYQDRTGKQVIYPIIDEKNPNYHGNEKEFVAYKDDANMWFVTSKNGSQYVPVLDADGNFIDMYLTADAYYGYAFNSSMTTLNKNIQNAITKTVDYAKNKYVYNQLTVSEAYALQKVIDEINSRHKADKAEQIKAENEIKQIKNAMSLIEGTTLAAKKDELKAQLDDPSITDKATIQANLADIEFAISSRETLVSNYTKTLETLKKEYDSILNSYKFGIITTDFATNVDEIVTRLGEIEVLKAGLTATLKTKNERNTELTALIKAKEEEIKVAMLADKDRLNAELKALQDEQKALKAEITSINSQITALNTENLGANVEGYDTSTIQPGDSIAQTFVNAERNDAYTSKVRIDGDNGQYMYAQPLSGNMYKIRVCFYEYYVYYHQVVRNDGVTRPYFLFGTTNSGQDILTCLASGARFSLILSVCVASINLVVGAIIGAIEGYYGGKIDLIIERIIDILSAIPFMIVITLLKYHLHTSHIIVLFIAFFLTGWIGMAGRTRMQFYRFKNQEYVLVARTLGASDKRIMFKHIFPNAIGTLITSCVLVIPGVIFSETSLSYLGIINLETGSLISVGTLLSKGNNYLFTYPHMILTPALFISLLELSFNLFGNGLRDAFNPSLRGTED